MANGLNKVMLIGNLGAHPEMRETRGGQAVMNLRLAVNESYKNRDGEKVDKTEWVNLVMWGKRAEGLEPHLSKGDKIYIEGRLQTRSWEADDGTKRYTTEVVLSDVILLGGKPKRRDDDGYDSPPPADDDDIPF